MAMNYIPSDDKHRISYMYDESAEGVRNDKSYKGIVIAEINNCKYDAINKLAMKIKTSHLYIDDWEASMDKNFQMNDSYRGIAYCSVDDEFDLKTGMKIARDRMLKKYYKRQDAILTNFAGRLMDAWAIICDMTRDTD